MPRSSSRPLHRRISPWHVALIGLVLSAGAASTVVAQPPPNDDPGPKDKTAIGWVTATPCLGEDDAQLGSAAERAKACPPQIDKPALLEAANGETYLLGGLSTEERTQLVSRKGRPVKLGGTFAWHDRLRTLEVSSIEPVTDEQAETARTDQPEFAMRQYFMTLLKPGPAQKDITDEKTAEFMRGHFGHMAKQAAAGTLLIAGPFGEQKPTRRLSGIYIYTVDTLEEAEALTQQDPAVAGGYFEAATLPWYAAASLGY